MVSLSFFSVRVTIQATEKGLRDLTSKIVGLLNGAGAAGVADTMLGIEKRILDYGDLAFVMRSRKFKTMIEDIINMKPFAQVHANNRAFMEWLMIQEAKVFVIPSDYPEGTVEVYYTHTGVCSFVRVSSNHEISYEE